MNRGVLLLALGSPLYGQMAFNAALSIKSEDPNIKIALFYTKGAISSLKKWHLPFFDSYHEVPEEDYKVNGTNQYQICKLRVADYTPFDETIYLDVDLLWCKGKKISDLFDELSNIDFTIGCGFYVDVKKLEYKRKYQLWGDFKQIINFHGLTEGKLWETWSAFSYFKKTEKVKAMFTEAIKVYYQPGTPCFAWAGGKPDEYCINVAMNKVDLHPHKEYFVPVYCGFIGGKKDEETILKNFWGFGFTGNKISLKDSKIYNDWVRNLCEANKIPDRFYHVDKKEQIPERDKI